MVNEENSKFIVTDITKIGDPQILLYNGTYYIYATTSARRGYHVRTSKDLINWSEPIRCFDKENPVSNAWADDFYWAPEVTYHNGKFVMHYSAGDDNIRFKWRFRIGVAVSDSPLGPFVDVYGEPMFDFGYAAIDASVLITENGNYMYYAKDGYGHVVDGIMIGQVYCVKLDDTLTKAVGEHKLMTTPDQDYERLSLPRGQFWNEGPNVIEYNGKYIMNYSTNHYRTNNYAICMAYADNPMGPWTKSKYNPIFSNDGVLFGAGHNAFFKTKDGELYTSFHVQTNPENPGADRRAVIGKVEFGVDEIGEITQKIVGCIK